MTRLRPPHVLFLHSISLYFGAFIRPLFLRSSITLYFSFLLSFTRASPPSFCRSHAVTTRSVAPPIHRPDLLSSVLPPLVSSIVLWSASLQLTSLGHGTVAGQVNLVLLMLERRVSLLLPTPLASGRFAVVLSSLSLLVLSIRPALLSSVSASVAQFICLQGQRPLDAFILRSLVQFLLCSVHLSLVAVFFPIKIQSRPSVVRLHYSASQAAGRVFVLVLAFVFFHLIRRLYELFLS